MKLATELAVAMILPVSVTVAAVGRVSYRSLERAALPQVVDRIDHAGRAAGAIADPPDRSKNAG